MPEPSFFTFTATGAEKPKEMEGVEPRTLSHAEYKASLNEHLLRSELPDLYGVARRVIDALEQRVGHSSLDIQNIADDLHFSKRTLQRRLREQGYCFSDLRDLVRRHHGIRIVLEGRQRVDDICITLDFADRSSLTLAFKRWTGFSPRAFGRLYRDYLA
ncbi:MAG: AraC family transcriptional regulator [Agarilytica sp.]